MMLILDPYFVGTPLSRKQDDRHHVFFFCHFQTGIAPMSLIYMTVILVQSHEKCGTWSQNGVLPYGLHYG